MEALKADTTCSIALVAYRSSGSALAQDAPGADEPSATAMLKR